jgi:hypothetical protein
MHLVAEDDAQEASRGTRFATCPLTKSALGSSMRSGLDPRFEKTQNLVSTKVPEVIESLRASCNGDGIVMAKVATSTMRELSETLDVVHVVWARLAIFSVYSTSGSRHGDAPANPYPSWWFQTHREGERSRGLPRAT